MKLYEIGNRRKKLFSISAAMYARQAIDKAMGDLGESRADLVDKEINGKSIMYTVEFNVYPPDGSVEDMDKEKTEKIITPIKRKIRRHLAKIIRQSAKMELTSFDISLRKTKNYLSLPLYVMTFSVKKIKSEDNETV